MKTVWIIEDNPNYRAAVVRGLQAIRPQFVVEPFRNCEDALAAPNATHSPDVVLMDIGLPGMDGIEGIGEIKDRFSDVSILVLTVFEDDDKIFRAFVAGASGYILKHSSITSVAESVELVLEGAATIDPRIAKRMLTMFAQLAPTKTDYGLNERERCVLECMARGLVRKQIAIEMDLNPHTINYIMRCIYRKLHVNGASAAVALAIRARLLGSSFDE